jgi:hypothetical protein
MRIHAIATLVAAFLLAGCTEQSERGGPGVKSNGASSKSKTTISSNGDSKTTITKTTTDSTDIIDKDKTFVVNKPLTETDLEQGESEDLTISIDRGSEFKQTVKLQFKPPQGVTVTPGDGMIGPDADDAKVVIAAAADAPVGKHKIDVTAVPESGKAVQLQIDIEVKKKD